MKVIIPILSDADLAALPAAISHLKSQKAEGFWILHSPAICLSTPDGLKEIDQEIAALKSAKEAASRRDDFPAAQSYKEQIDAKILDKDALVRGAHKSLPESVRAPLYAKALEVATKSGMPGIVDCLPDVIEASEVFKLLDNLTARWPEQFEHGDFVMAWPRALAGAVPAPVAAPAEPVAPRIPKPPKPVLTRAEELRESRFGGVRSTAQKLGVFEDGVKMDVLIERIIAKENEAKAEPALI